MVRNRNTKVDQISVIEALGFLLNRDLRRNFCRNPDGDRTPWCYTTDPQTRWEYCNLAKCGTIQQVPSPPSSSQPQTPTPSDETPTEEGHWIKFGINAGSIPHFSTYFVSVSVLDCKIGSGKTYRGPTSITSLGVTCQAWSAQSPHKHNSFTPESHPFDNLEGNVSVHGPVETISNEYLSI